MDDKKEIIIEFEVIDSVHICNWGGGGSTGSRSHGH